MSKGIVFILCWAISNALAVAQTATTHTDWYVIYSGGEPTRQQHVGARQAGDLNLQGTSKNDPFTMHDE